MSRANHRSMNDFLGIISVNHEGKSIANSFRETDKTTRLFAALEKWGVMAIVEDWLEEEEAEHRTYINGSSKSNLKRRAVLKDRMGQMNENVDTVCHA